jgi:hypothetical protein
VEAQDELRALVAALPAGARARVPGVYVAFDPSPRDVVALAACDDDGDYVVVLSEALLVLAEHATHAAALDEGGAQDALATLASHYAREQQPNARLLPPPAGAFETEDTRELETAHTLRFREALSGIIARELSMMTAGDLVCPRPTATRERGDDVWTDEESRNARALADVLYASPARRVARDEDATKLIVAAMHEPRGYVAWLDFFARMEAERASPPPWSYPKIHGAGAERLHLAQRAPIAQYL